ncbi:hypothetical protein ACFQ3S_13955 [Mucilaginibacter terrae]|uniref:hypothetical protein n=1 Tax=Mucilaginibacter terrae TaxID=1955052 RepID=UPI003642F937
MFKDFFDRFKRKDKTLSDVSSDGGSDNNADSGFFDLFNFHHNSDSDDNGSCDDGGDSDCGDGGGEGGGD